MSRGEMSLAEVQCHLDKEGASDLVINLIMNATSDRIFQESILLAIALLEGGNTVIQVKAQCRSHFCRSAHMLPRVVFKSMHLHRCMSVSHTHTHTHTLTHTHTHWCAAWRV